MIKFDGPTVPRSDLTCPVCGSQRASLTLTVEPTPTEGGKLALFACLGCGSYFYGGTEPVIGYDHVGFEPKFWLHYAQVGAGISTMVAPLMALGPRGNGSLLDVGCGFGFVPHFWEKSGRGPAVGLESAVYGKLGKELLGVEIHHEYYNQCHAIAGRKFDIVYAAEVIEHVRDPKAFLLEISQGLADAGIMIITTPSATVVAPEADPSTLRTALSPGFHYFLFSRAALKATFVAAGFSHVVVRDNGHQLVAWASRHPFDEPDRADFEWDKYLNYLEQLSQHADPSVKGGALYRLFKDSLNTGRSEQARAAFDNLSALALANYAIDFTNPDMGLVLKSSSLISRLEQSPAWLGGALLFGGIHIGHTTGDQRAKLRMIDAAIRIFKHDIATSPQFTHEPGHLLPFAEQQYRIGLSEALTMELHAGLGRHVPPGATAPKASLVDGFVQTLTSLTNAIVASIPAILAKKSRRTVARWERSIRKRINRWSSKT